MKLTHQIAVQPRWGVGITVASALFTALQAGAVEARAPQDPAASSPQASDEAQPIPPAIRAMTPKV